MYNGGFGTFTDSFSVFWGTSAETQKIVPQSHLQKINHFPGSKAALGDKASLSDLIQKHPLYNSVGKFFPVSFILPRDREELFAAMKSKPRSLFIAKPPKGSCGNGIKLVSFTDFYSIPQGSVVSEYISKPLCIDDFKFDLRVYVLVTCFAPLSAFVCREGLARFATESYSTGKESKFSHLTNATLNKHSRNWAKDAFKWTLSEVLLEIEHRWNQPHDKMFAKICAVIRNTLAMVQPVMAPRERRSVSDSYFELFGFDIIIDRDFKMYLLEVNCMPSLNTEEEVDFEVKAPMVAQALSIVGVPDLDLEELKKTEKRFKLPDGGIKAFDEMAIKQEDERNKLSGNGFVRIFPCAPDAIKIPLIKPAVNIPALGLRISSESDFDGQTVFDDDRMAILVNYLGTLEKRLKQHPVDARLIARIQCFLVAQGYRVARSVVSVRALLRHFIERAKAWVTPEVLERNAKENTTDDAKIQALVCGADLVRVKNVRLLFP